MLSVVNPTLGTLVICVSFVIYPWGFVDFKSCMMLITPGALGFEPTLFTQQIWKVVIPMSYIEEFLAYVVFHCTLDVVWF
jgi:hypothetical protein